MLMTEFLLSDSVRIHSPLFSVAAAGVFQERPYRAEVLLDTLIADSGSGN